MVPFLQKCKVLFGLLLYFPFDSVSIRDFLHAERGIERIRRKFDFTLHPSAFVFPADAGLSVAGGKGETGKIHVKKLKCAAHGFPERAGLPAVDYDGRRDVRPSDAGIFHGKCAGFRILFEIRHTAVVRRCAQDVSRRVGIEAVEKRMQAFFVCAGVVRIRAVMAAQTVKVVVKNETCAVCRSEEQPLSDPDGRRYGTDGAAFVLCALNDSVFAAVLFRVPIRIAVPAVRYATEPDTTSPAFGDTESPPAASEA